MTEIGKPNPSLFDIDRYLDVIEGLICVDEINLAMRMLKEPPAWYADHPTERMLEIRDSLARATWTPIQYSGIYASLQTDGAAALAQWSHRYQALEREVRKMNEAGKCAHVMELAPGAMVVREGLRALGVSATYEWMGLEYVERNNPMPNAGVIFCAFEILEHLSEPEEIYRNYMKFGREADVVLISTPLYCYGGGMGDWRNRPLGHLKTLSPRSLHETVSAMFRGYEWSVELSDVIVLTGRKA